MKKLFLIVGLFCFFWSGYYLSQNYTLVHLTEEQVVQLDSNTLLQSSFLDNVTGIIPKVNLEHSEIVFRVGSFAIVKSVGQ